MIFCGKYPSHPGPFDRAERGTMHASVDRDGNEVGSDEPGDHRFEEDLGTDPKLSCACGSDAERVEPSMGDSPLYDAMMAVMDEMREYADSVAQSVIPGQGAKAPPGRPKPPATVVAVAMSAGDVAEGIGCSALDCIAEGIAYELYRARLAE
jgi:hypothetical protein